MHYDAIMLIRQSGNGHIRKDELLEFISANDATATNNDELNNFDWIIEWGREALILSIMLIRRILL